MLIGRTAECAAVDQLLEDARGGRGGALVIRGPAGIGKSALLRYASARATGMCVLSAAGVESEAELLFAGLGLVSVGDTRLRFRHPLLRSVAYQALPPPDRRLGHLALAETLRSAGTRTRRAWHLAAAIVRPDDETAGELEVAASEARERAAPAAAAAALEAAARLSSDTAARIRRLEGAAVDLHSAGHGERAAELLEDALELAGDPLQRADLVHLQVGVQLLDAPCVQSRVRLVAEADRIQSLDPAQSAAMLADGSLLAVMAGEPRVALALAERANGLAGGDPGRLALVTANAFGVALLLCGRGDEATRHLERAEGLLASADPVTAAQVTAYLAHSRSWRGEHLRARETLRRLVEDARRRSALPLLPYALAALAEAELHLGDWHAAYADASESVALAAETGQRTELAHSLARLAHVEAGMGYEADCREHADRALALAREREVGSVEILAGAALGQLELGLGRLEAAVERLEQLRRSAEVTGLREPGVSLWAADLAEAHVLRHEDDAARAVLSPLEDQARRLGRTQALAAAERVLGLLEGDEAPFERARSRLEDRSLPFDLARLELCRGESLLAQGRDAPAREALHAAVAAFDRLSAAPWRVRAQARLDALGERPVTPSMYLLADLTPHEMRVARLVSDGVTNRETAAALFISPKTVEIHLTHIYRKLGVRSRTQLARELARHMPRPPAGHE